MFSWGFDDGTTRKRIGKTERELLYNSQRGKCNYCGRKLESAYMHIDHKTPVARNGSNRISNLQVICGPCNTRKGSMTDGEFRRRYKLPSSRAANGPPSKVIPQKYFEEITKTVQKKRAQARKRQRDDLWW